jgi:hypothetical protein
VSAGDHPLIDLLPAVYQRILKDPNRPPNLVLLALLEVMVELQRPDLEVLAELDTYFDRYQAPEAFVPLLASWLDLDWLFTLQPERLDAAAAREISPLEIGRLRELVAAATHFARLRGTAQCLLDFMETATNVHGLAVDDRVPERSFYLRVWVPPEGKPWRAILRRMLDVLKPAYTKADLFPSEDLVSRLAQDIKLPGLAVHTEVEASDPRPRRIHLRVLAPGSDLTPDMVEKMKTSIDPLTPPGEDTTAVEETDAGIRIKTFREWRNS